MSRNINYDNLNLDDIVACSKLQSILPQETTSEQPPEVKLDMSTAAKYRIIHRLHYTNVDDLIAIFDWTTPETIRNLWVECSSPEVKSVQDLSHGHAWEMQRAGWLEETKIKFIADPYPSYGDIWLLNTLDKKYFSWCSSIWADMSYRQRLHWLACVASKRARGITPHLILMDIVDPHHSWRKNSNEHV